MSFVKRVQKNEVSRPNQRSFCPEKWNTELDYDTADDQEKSLHQAGLWFHRAFGELRKQLSYAGDKKIAKKNKLLAFITRANLNALRYDDATRAIRENITDIDPIEVTRQQIVPKFSDSEGAEHSIDEVIQADIDGLQLPIQMVLGQADDALELDIFTAHFDLQRVERDYQLGAFYGVLEQYWEDCLWNDYRVELDNRLLLTPGTPFFAAWKVIGQFRRNILVHSNTTAQLMGFYKHHRHKTHDELGLPRPIRAIETTQGGIRYCLTDDVGLKRSAVATYLLIHDAMEPYYSGYSAFHSPRLGGATIAEVVRCWAVLCSLAKCLQDTPQAPPATLMGDPLMVHVAAPLVDKTALLNAVSESLEIGMERSLALIDFLTFDHTEKSDSGKNELWTQPLIPYSEDKLLILFAPLLWGTTQRNVNIWLRQMGADLAARGNFFETHVRQALEHSAHQSRLKKHTRVMKHAFTFNLPKPATTRYEDIDLLMLIGNTLLVGEVKCFLQPADSLSTFSHRDKVISACDQLARKIDCIRDYEKSFRKQCLKANFPLPDRLSIQPVVVLNGPAHCGIPYNDIPIVDTAILSKFLTGVIRQNITETANDGVISEDRIILFADLADAELNLAGYLSNPPQLAYIKNGLSERDASPKHTAKNIGPICYRYFDVAL
ncbi:NERD domain-containing protein [Pseudomonas sp. D2002]|uniref:NERD domain-containing protein n=1 Tax=Pseudomonas sp. D2002 TaxID=2726980 RepID=UPI0015A2AF26|nr:NERD domain-containing protein [Pseudomonas sp. D2002]NWA85531.1 NERD domain-containing protein [Pseudomonas sp. D2002]